MYIIGLFMEGPNTGACLFHNGKLVAMAEEERFNRIKTASEMFPSNAIKYCLKEGEICLQDITLIAIAWDHAKYPKDMNKHMSSIVNRDLDPLAEQFERIVHDKLSPGVINFEISIKLKQIDPLATPEICLDLMILQSW